MDSQAAFWGEAANLEGKVAVVVGGAVGIGRAISMALAAAGVDVALCDIDSKAGEETAADLSRLQRLVTWQPLDVRDHGAIEAFFETFDAASDRLDVLVNVAGGVFRRPFLESTPDEWDDDHRRNFLYILHTTRFAVPRMRAGGAGGSIVNITTIEAHRACPNFAVYGAYKTAITSFARSMALELGALGIRVNNVAVDATPTPGASRYRPPEIWSDPERAETLIAEGARMYLPLERVGTPEDHAKAVLFLASDLSAWTTGTTVHVDGGAWASSGWVKWPDRGYFPSPMAVPYVLERLFPASLQSEES